MFVGLREEEREVHRVLNVVVPRGREAHQVSAATLHLDEIRERLLIELGLGEHADHKGAVLNQADGAVL